MLNSTFNFTFHRGSPPHIGWWATTYHPGDKTLPSEFVWRWWNGSAWTHFGLPETPLSSIMAVASVHFGNPKGLFWTDYWPINGRVERMNPSTGEVTGRIRNTLHRMGRMR